MDSLPANIDAERTILGAILLDNEAFYDDTVDLLAEDFHLDSHRRIYRCMNDILFGMVDEAKSADIVTLSNELRRRKEIEAVGGTAYLASLTEGLPMRPRIEEYVRIVKDKARLRKIVAVCSGLAAKAEDQSEKADSILAEAQSQLLSISAEGENGYVKIGDVTPAVEADVKSKRAFDAEDKRIALGMTWGIEGLDKKTKGIFGGEFTVVGGESGGGKTPFLCQVSLANGREETPVGIFSLEMTKEQLCKRFYPLMGDIITGNMMRDPRLMNKDVHVPEMERLSLELQRLPIYIDDRSPVHIKQLRARIRMWRRKLGIKLFWIDYLQLIRHSARTEVEGIRDIVFELRDEVKADPEIHIGLLSQFSQGVKFAKKQRRGKDDLYGGSAIHHAAQNVFIITIEDPDKRDPGDLLDVEISVRKQREGSTGKVSCHWDRDHLRYCYPQPQTLGRFS